MGCASSSISSTGDNTHTTGQTHNQRTPTDNTNNHGNADTTTTTDTTLKQPVDGGGGGGTYYPDDNAIYGFDLYQDDKNKGGEGGTGGSSGPGGDGEKTEKEGSSENKTNANQSQFDDAGFFGQTDSEKRDQDLFEDPPQKRDETAPQQQNDDVTPPAPITDDATTGDKNEEHDVIVPVPAAEDKNDESDVIVPVPATEDKNEESDVIVPVPVDDVKEPEEKVEEKQPEEKQSDEEDVQVIPTPPLAEDTVREEKEEQLKSQEQPVPDDGVEKGDMCGDVGEYTPTTTGLMTMFVDLRSVKKDEDEEVEEDPRASLGSGQVWQDHDFSLHHAITDRTLASSLTWKRPFEISSSPRLFSESTTRYDIGQGGAGTCWFLSTVANVSEHPDQLKQVIPEGAYSVASDDYTGVFHARFWRFGQWEDVYIDDFLPIIHDTIPWGARSATDENEFWVSLLEKAFARYHGSYNAVYGGQPGDAYLALTGGVAERIDFDDNDQKPNKLYRRIHNAVQSGALITCTVPDQYDNVCGLVGGHAYSLTGTVKVKRTQLLRIRNPWGNTEWKGAWCDGSAEWAGVSEDEVSRVVKDDGEFWICLKDFMTYFDQTTICSLTPDFDQDGRSDSLNYVTNIYGEWHGEAAAGFKDKLRNPRFLFTVPESESEVQVVVQLIQRRKNRQVDNFQVRCDLFKVLCDNGETAAMEIMGENTNSYSPETQCSFRHKVTKGTYAVVPSTIEEGLEKSFLLRIFSACPLSNVGELSRSHKLMSCEQETSFSYDGQDHALEFCQAISGGWKSGVNSGGQIGNRDSHASNPQFVLSINQPTLVVMHVMQEHSQPRMPVGLRLFPTGEAPLSIDQIYDMYERALVDTDGANYKFVESWDVKAAYMLQPGDYTLLLHMDKADVDKLFTLVLKATHSVGVRGFQTGE